MSLMGGDRRRETEQADHRELVCCEENPETGGIVPVLIYR